MTSRSYGGMESRIYDNKTKASVKNVIYGQPLRNIVLYFWHNLKMVIQFSEWVLCQQDSKSSTTTTAATTASTATATTAAAEITTTPIPKKLNARQRLREYLLPDHEAGVHPIDDHEKVSQYYRVYFRSSINDVTQLLTRSPRRHAFL